MKLSFLKVRGCHKIQSDTMVSVNFVTAPYPDVPLFTYKFFLLIYKIYKPPECFPSLGGTLINTRIL